MAAKRSKNNNKTTEISGCIIRSGSSAKSLRGPSDRIRTGKTGKLCRRKDGTQGYRSTAYKRMTAYRAPDLPIL
ncbi:hypothetical protein [Sphingobacterium sp.]|uniref:hypothetical protein n=1 Tax=Sphingobacterium sp. TaxID=341027 RepID=UPI002FD9E567